MRTLAAALAALLLGGCVYSLEPFYSPDALVASPVPDGRWHRLERDGTPETGATWVFEGNRVTAFDNRGQWRAFRVRYFKVGEALFVDTLPEEMNHPSESDGYWQIHHLRFHLVSRVEHAEGRLALRPLTAQGFHEATKSAPMRGIIKRGDYATMVAAAPADWKAFLEKHGKRDDVFEKGVEIVFVKARD